MNGVEISSIRVVDIIPVWWPVEGFIFTDSSFDKVMISPFLYYTHPRRRVFFILLSPSFPY